MGITPPDYVIEIRTPEGELVGVLKDASDIILTESLNAPRVLTFMLPANDLNATNITRANELWVRKIDTDTVIVKLKLLRKEDGR